MSDKKPHKSFILNGSKRCLETSHASLYGPKTPKTPKTPKSASSTKTLFADAVFPVDAPKLSIEDLEVLIEGTPCNAKSYTREAIINTIYKEPQFTPLDHEDWARDYQRNTDDYYDRHYLLKKSKRVAETGGRHWGSSIRIFFAILIPLLSTMCATVSILMLAELISQAGLDSQANPSQVSKTAYFSIDQTSRTHSNNGFDHKTLGLNIDSIGSFFQVLAKSFPSPSQVSVEALDLYAHFFTSTSTPTTSTPGFRSKNGSEPSDPFSSATQSIYMWLFCLIMLPNIFSLLINYFAAGAREKESPHFSLSMTSLALGILEGAGELCLVYTVLFNSASSSKYMTIYFNSVIAAIGNPLAVFMRKVSRLRQAVYLFGSVASLGSLIAYLILASSSVEDSIFAYQSTTTSVLILGLAGVVLTILPWSIKYIGFYEKRYYSLGCTQQLGKLLANVLGTWLLWVVFFKQSKSEFWVDAWSHLFSDGSIFVPAIIALITTFLSFLLAIAAISICIQVTGFSIPMLLAPALSAGIVYLRCNQLIGNSSISDSGLACDLENQVWQLIFIASATLLTALSNHHILFTSFFPMPLNRAVWHRMLYSSVFSTGFLILGRRQGILRIRLSRALSPDTQALGIDHSKSLSSDTLGENQQYLNEHSEPQSATQIEPKLSTKKGKKSFRLSKIFHFEKPNDGHKNEEKQQKQKRIRKADQALGSNIKALGDYMVMDVNKFMKPPTLKAQNTRQWLRESGQSILELNTSLQGLQDDTNAAVFLCTTMWHENEKEIDHLIRSFLRVDRERKSAGDTTHYESHVFFDDAFEADGRFNEYVEIFLEHIYLYCDSKIAFETKNSPKSKLLSSNSKTLKHFITPYGSQVKALLPYGLTMYIHLKDKSKVRNKKRWSQVMYLFYIMKYRVARDNLDLSNTYILTTDGDVEFDVPSMRDLLFYLKRNELVGGVCSRIFPLGNGPIAWFQRFEYSLGHWLTKPAEQVLGTVLCLPGCFSMFRCIALSEIMHSYTSEASTAKEFLQYDQGEDRWLTTLLLKKGWLLQYASSADAYTFCPMDFDEFFNQRRRWLTSTIANLIDLIVDQDLVVSRNISIGKYFLHYQALLLGASLISPSIAVITIAIGTKITFDISEIFTCIAFTVLIVIYTMICLKLQHKTQLLAAQFYTYLLAGVMIFTTTGLTIALVRNLSKPGIGLGMILIIVVIVTAASVFHPREIHNLPFGIVYLLYLPSISIMLLIYSLAQIDNVSWGTREGKSKKVVKEQSDWDKLKLFAIALWDNILSLFVHSSERQARDDFSMKSARGEHNNVIKPRFAKGNCASFGAEMAEIDEMNRSESSLVGDCRHEKTMDPHGKLFWENNLDSSAPDLRSGLLADADATMAIEPADEYQGLAFNADLSVSEWRFWRTLLNRHLDADLAKMYHDLYAKDMFSDLRSLRESAISGIILANGFFTCIYCALAFQDRLFILENNPLLLILSCFSLLLLLQFCCMLVHRWQMLAHVIATGFWYEDGRKKYQHVQKKT